MAAIKEYKQLKYDSIPRGSSATIPYTVLKLNKKVDDPSGDIPNFEKNHDYVVGDKIKVEIAENMCYFEATKNFTSRDVFTLKGDNWKSIGQHTPYDLSGKILMMTVKKEQYDAKAPTRDTLPTTYNTEIRDESAVTGAEDRDVFRITIDCDNPTAGEISPLWVNNGNGMKEVFHGMYGGDPTLGETFFRIPKRCTFIDPGPYFFDIRVLHKKETFIGDLRENQSFLHVTGYLTIYGTPTNRASVFDPFVYDALQPPQGP